MDAAYAALAALFDRSRSGRGHKIDIAMIDSMTRFMAPRIVPYLGSGEIPKRSGARDSVIAVYQTFETADDPITLGLGNDAIWKRFWRSSRQSGNRGRGAIRNECRSACCTSRDRREDTGCLKKRGRNQWLDLFAQANVPAGPVNRVDQVTDDAELIRRGLFYTDRANERRVPQVGLGIHVDGSSASYRLPPPKLGQHTEEVLREWLGCDATAFAKLREAKAVYRAVHDTLRGVMPFTNPFQGPIL